MDLAAATYALASTYGFEHEAQYKLGMMLSSESAKYHAKPDEKDAIAYFSYAAAQGNQGAIEELEKIIKKKDPSGSFLNWFK